MLAAFHIIRANHSYFMASNGWLDAGWAWHPEYDIEVGEPLGPARTVDSAEGRLYVRNFTKADVRDGAICSCKNDRRLCIILAAH